MKINKFILFIINFFLIVLLKATDIGSPKESDKSNIFPGTEIEADTKFQCENMATLKQKTDKYLSEGKKEAEKKFEADSNFEKLKDTFIPFNKLMNSCLYDPYFGYYANEIKISDSENEEAHFHTFPYTMSPNFGRMIAYQAYAMWRSMIYSGDIEANEIFYFVEFGAGEGILARDILQWIEDLSNSNLDETKKTHWKEFNKVVRYIICEKSPKLMEIQIQKNDKFLKNGKIEILNFDAKEGKNLGKKLKGLVLSNELPDAFPVHEVKQTPNNKVKVCVLIPYIEKSYIASLENKELKSKIEKEDKELRELISEILKDEETKKLFDKTDCNIMYEKLEQDSYVISYESWLELRRDLSKKNIDEEAINTNFNARVNFKKIYIDHEYFPELKNYIKRHWAMIKHHNKLKSKDFLDICARQEIKNSQGYDIQDQNTWIINFETEFYLKKVSDILEKGFVLTIDYGENCALSKFNIEFPTHNIRMKPKEASNLVNFLLKRDLYDFIGFVDITSDVNFADMCLIGNELNLQTIFFADQELLNMSSYAVKENVFIVPYDLSNDNFATGPKESREFSEILTRFRILIQKKVSDKNQFRVLNNSKDLFPDIEKEINQEPTDEFIALQLHFSGLMMNVLFFNVWGGKQKFLSILYPDKDSNFLDNAISILKGVPLFKESELNQKNKTLA
jgi:SAM-dependent MidA family methyltransferase